MPTFWDHVVAVVIALAYPIRGALALRGRLRDVAGAELSQARLRIYRMAMAALWASAIAIVALWVAHERGWAMMGLALTINGGTVGILFGLLVVAAVTLRQARNGVDERQAAAMKRRIGGGERLMPHSSRELTEFTLLSISAGLCEEVIYRGFFIWYLQALGLPLLPAAAVSCVIFGLAHLYQGTRGVILTTVVGGFLAGVYLLSGSLFPGMLIHALMDVYTGRLLFEVFRREAAEGVAA